MIKKLLLLLPFCYLLNSIVRAQDFKQSKEYPKDMFQYPLELAPTTAGSFGELRPNHFHSGLDFKTLQRIGIPVHAASNGYVSRLKVQFGGFGLAVYIDHPGGYTTVYGHLDHLSPELTQIIKAEQSKQQKWDVDVIITPFTINLYKGQVFAWSGNAGASGGPHLHFEIRDSKSQETINPQLFGLTIPDKVPPTITGVSLYHLNGPFSDNTFRQTYAVKGANGNYTLAKPETLELSGNIGFGISAMDRNSTSMNKNGVYSIELKVDGKTVYTFAVERFAFDQTHAINAYIDFAYQQKTGGFIQKCFVMPGSKITLYPQSVNRGVVSFNDNQLHDVEYLVKDIAGNASTIKLKVQASIPKERMPVYQPKGTLLHYNAHNEFKNDKVRLIVEPGNLYDDLDLQYTVLPKRPGSLSALHRIHNRLTPIHDSLNLWIKPDAELGKYADKAVVVSANVGAVESEYADGYVKGKIRSFGDYDIKIDTVPPVIVPANLHSGASLAASRVITFRVSDGLSGVKTFSGKIDGKWVLVEHDYKSKMFIYTFDGSITPGKHTFEATATDYKDNVSQFTADFYR